MAKTGSMQGGRRGLLGVVAAVALIVAAGAVFLWLRAPATTIDDAAAREEAPVDPPVERPAAVTAPAAPAPTRQETSIQRDATELALTRMPVPPQERESIAKATLSLRVVEAATGEPCAKTWISSDVDRSRSIAGVADAALALAARAASYTDRDGRVELVFPAEVAMVVSVASPRRGASDLEQKIEPLEPDERRLLTIALTLPPRNRGCLRCVAAATGLPIEGASLTLGKEQLGTSDRDGRFVLVV